MIDSRLQMELETLDAIAARLIAARESGVTGPDTPSDDQAARLHNAAARISMSNPIADPEQRAAAAPEYFESLGARNVAAWLRILRAQTRQKDDEMPREAESLWPLAEDELKAIQARQACFCHHFSIVMMTNLAGICQQALLAGDLKGSPSEQSALQFVQGTILSLDQVDARHAAAFFRLGLERALAGQPKLSRWAKLKSLFRSRKTPTPKGNP